MAVGMVLGRQAQQRRWQNYTDQHGRKWGATIEVKSGHPVGALNPRFDAPWLPAEKYVSITPDADGTPWALQIDYAQGALDMAAAQDYWRDKMLRVGVELHGQTFDPKKPSVVVLQAVGPKPASPEPYRAALAENGYILGLRPFDETSTADRKLRALLTPPPAAERGVGDVSEYADTVTAAPRVARGA